MSFRHTPSPGRRYSESAAARIVGQTFPIIVGETTVEGTANACELIEDTGELWLTVEVPDDTPWLDAINP